MQPFTNEGSALKKQTIMTTPHEMANFYIGKLKHAIF